MKKLTVMVSVLIVIFSFISVTVNAEMKTFIRDYTYQASEIDSKQSSRIIATEQVKRLLLEELGTYLESHTEVINYQLTKDQVTTLTGGIVKTKIVEEKWDGEKYWMKAKIDADPDEVAKSIERLRNDSRKVKELEDSRKKTDDTMKDMDKLRTDLETDKDNKDKINKYNEKVRSLKVLQSMAATFKAMSSGKPEEAMGQMFNLMGTMIENSSEEDVRKLNSTQEQERKQNENQITP